MGGPAQVAAARECPHSHSVVGGGRWAASRRRYGAPEFTPRAARARVCGAVWRGAVGRPSRLPAELRSRRRTQVAGDGRTAGAQGRSGAASASWRMRVAAHPASPHPTPSHLVPRRFGLVLEFPGVRLRRAGRCPQCSDSVSFFVRLSSPCPLLRISLRANVINENQRFRIADSVPRV